MATASLLAAAAATSACGVTLGPISCDIKSGDTVTLNQRQIGQASEKESLAKILKKLKNNASNGKSVSMEITHRDYAERGDDGIPQGDEMVTVKDGTVTFLPQKNALEIKTPYTRNTELTVQVTQNGGIKVLSMRSTDPTCPGHANQYRKELNNDQDTQFVINEIDSFLHYGVLQIDPQS